MSEKRVILVVVTLLIVLSGCGRSPSNNSVNISTPTPTVGTPVAAAATPTPAPPSNILFIIDASGSMRAKAGDKTKMDAAKEVVTQIAKDLPAGTNAGLMAYGHREKNDCKDVELLIPVSPLDAAAFSEKVNALQPIGQTPISYSIRQAAGILFPVKGKRTVILISDGEETCKEDPCAVAADLKKADVELKIHVVGFGIDKPAARKQLECIATAAGGLYKDAGSAAELQQTLEGLAKAPDEPTGDKGRLVVDHVDSNGKRIFWCVEVHPEGVSGIPNRVFESCNNDKAVENAFDVKPGRYDIWVYGGSPRSKPGKRTVEIIAGTDTRLPLEQTGRLFLNIVDQNGTPVQYVAQVHSLADEISGSGTFYSGEIQELMPGSYDIGMWGGPIGLENQKGVVIRSGQETKIDIKITR